MQLFNLGRRLLGERLLKRLVKPTIYAQFVAGEDTEEIKPVVNTLRNQGIRPIFAYAVEDDIGCGMHKHMLQACTNMHNIEHSQ